MIGSDSVNRFARTAVENRIIPPLDVGAGTDGYPSNQRRRTVGAGSFSRAATAAPRYAVYDFFERQAGCATSGTAFVFRGTETVRWAGSTL